MRRIVYLDNNHSMSAFILFIILGIALLLAVSGAVLVTLVRRGVSTLFLPGLGIVISSQHMLALVTIFEILIVGSAVMIWRAL
jgi:hypothetical protein